MARKPDPKGMGAGIAVPIAKPVIRLSPWKLAPKRDAEDADDFAKAGAITMTGKQPKPAKAGVAVAKPSSRRVSPWNSAKMDIDDADDFAKPTTAERKQRAPAQKRADSKKLKEPPRPPKNAMPPEKQVPREWLLESCRLAHDARASNGDPLLDPDAIALLDRVLDEARMPPAAQCLLARMLLPTNHKTWHLSNGALQKRAGLDARGNDEADGWSEALDALEELQLIQVLRFGSASSQGGPTPQPNGHDSAMGHCESQSGAGSSAAVTGGGVLVKTESEAPGPNDAAHAVLAGAASVPCTTAAIASASLSVAAGTLGVLASVSAAAAASASALLPAAVTVGASPPVLAAAATTAVDTAVHTAGHTAVDDMAATPAFDLRAFTVDVAMPLLTNKDLLKIAPPEAGFRPKDKKAERLSKLEEYAQSLERDRAAAGQSGTKGVVMPMLVKAELVKVAPEAGLKDWYAKEELVSKLEAYVQSFERDRTEMGAAGQSGTKRGGQPEIRQGGKAAGGKKGQAETVPGKQENGPPFDLEVQVAKALASKPGCGGAGAVGVRFVRLRMEARAVEALLIALRLADPLMSSAAPLRLLPAPGSSKGACDCDAPRPACVVAIERKLKHEYDDSVVPDLEPGHYFGSRVCADAFLLAVEVKCAVRAALMVGDPALQPGKKQRGRVPNRNEVDSGARAYALSQPPIAIQRLRSLLALGGGGGPSRACEASSSGSCTPTGMGGNDIPLSLLDGPEAARDAARLIAAEAVGMLSKACALPLPSRPWLAHFHAGAQLALAVWAAVPLLEEEASQLELEASQESRELAVESRELAVEWLRMLLWCTDRLGRTTGRGDVADDSLCIGGSGLAERSGDASELKHLRGQCYHRLLINLGHMKESADEILELCYKALRDPRVRGEWCEEVAKRTDRLAPAGAAADDVLAAIEARVKLPQPSHIDRFVVARLGEEQKPDDWPGVHSCYLPGEIRPLLGWGLGQDVVLLPSPTAGAMEIEPIEIDLTLELEAPPCAGTPRSKSGTSGRGGRAGGSRGRKSSKGEESSDGGQPSGADGEASDLWERADCLRVERKAAEFYSRPEFGGWFELGSPSNSWDEGSQLRMLCGLLLWKEIRAPGVGAVWAYTSQRLPLDFGTPHFYTGRKDILTDRLQQLSAATAPELAQIVRDAYTKHYGKMCGLVHWSTCHLRISQALAVCLGGSGVAALLGRFVREGFFSDLPDLTLVRAFRVVRDPPACGASGGVGGGEERREPLDMLTWLQGVSQPDAPPVRFNIGRTMPFRKSDGEKRVKSKTVASPEEPVPATLEAEPTNKHDPKAIKMIVEGEHVGYVPRTHNWRVEPGDAWLVDTGVPDSNSWVVEAAPCNVLDVGGACLQPGAGGKDTGSEGGVAHDELVFECALVEVKGPGDSFDGRLGQLLWLRELRRANVNSRLCYIEEPRAVVKPQGAGRSNVQARQAAGAQAARDAGSLGDDGALSKRKAPCESAKRAGKRAVRTPPPRLIADDEDAFA
jgi:hypothetical protein